MDALVERLSRTVAQRTSRRGFLGYLGKALVGGMVIPLLPINRVVEQAQAQMSDESGAAAEGEGGDLTSCDYWRYCGFDGYLCSCCGGALTSCPPGTVASPTSWVGTCQHPTDGKEYIIAYRDCCGKDVCNRCFCDNNKGQVPIYRPQLDNDIIWCFGAKNFAYHCTTAIRLGAKT
jgi:methylamine dehydrogenase light chain